MKNESRSPKRRPRPLAWVALAVSTVVAVAVWGAGTQPTPDFIFAWLGPDLTVELALLVLAVIVAVILNIAAAWRGRANLIIALIAFLVLLAPFGIIYVSQTG